MQRFTDHYSVLGVSSYASAEEIKRAYRRLAKRCHPDVTQTSASAQRFIEVDNAYKTLSDPVKRREYDHQRFAQSQIKTAAPPSQRTSHASYQWQARPSSQGTSHASYQWQARSSSQGASHASYQWQAAQDDWRRQSAASSIMSESAGRGCGCGHFWFVALVGVICWNLISFFFFPLTITITATGFDQVSPSQHNISVVFKKDLRIHVTLCLGTNQQCNLHATDPSELASPGLTIRPGSSERVYFTAGEDYHITIVSLSNRLPHVNLDLTIQQDG